MDVSVGECMNISSFVRGTFYNVFRLETNRKYLFRARAENQYGVSDPLKSVEPFTAKFPFTIPEPPGQPRVSYSGSDSATLTWEWPRYDGSSKIQADTRSSAPLWRRIVTGSSSTTASSKTQLTWPTASSSDTNRVPRSSQKRGRNEQTVAVLVAVQDQGQIHRPRSPRRPAAHQSHRTYADLHHLHLTVAAGSRVG